MQSRLKMWALHGLSLALAAALLAYLLGKQKWENLSGQFHHVQPTYLAMAGLIAVGYWFVRVGRWRWMTTLESQRISWPRAWISMLAGLGVGLVTPFRGGEVVRPMFVPKGARLRLAGWVVVERLFDLSAVLTLCLLGLVYAIGSGLTLVSGGRISPWLLVACPLLLAGAMGVPLLLHYRPRRLWELFKRILPGKTKDLAEAKLEWGQFGTFYVTSLAAEMLSILAIYCCLRAFGPIPMLTACALTPVVMLNNLLPATPGGFGVREALAVVVFGAFGFTQPMVLAAYLTNALIVLIIPAALGVIAAWVSGVVGQLERPE